MKTLKISDELYEQLKSFIVDPFDDTPEVVIGRLIEIARKAKSRWSAAEVRDRPSPSERPAIVPPREPPSVPEEPPYEQVEQEVIL